MESDLTFKITVFRGEENRHVLHETHGMKCLSQTIGMNLSIKCCLSKFNLLKMINKVWSKLSMLFS